LNGQTWLLFATSPSTNTLLVDWSIVWVTATEDVPLLRGKIKALLSQLEEENQP